MQIFNVFASDTNKNKDAIYAFEETLREIDLIQAEQASLIMGDFNATIGNLIVDDVMRR